MKPANIKVTDDGTLKVLDFGLAKALDPASSASSGADQYASPTMTSPAMTQMGVILGTAAYMSPEQAKGRPVDKRADIWAFGVVVWEMMTGRRLFEGDSVSETLAAVLKDYPQLDRLPAQTPSSVRRLLARCLERDPKLRLRDIGEARILLGQRPIRRPHPTARPVGRTRRCGWPRPWRWAPLQRLPRGTSNPSGRCRCAASTCPRLCALRPVRACMAGPGARRQPLVMAPATAPPTPLSS